MTTLYGAWKSRTLFILIVSNMFNCCKSLPSDSLDTLSDDVLLVDYYLQYRSSMSMLPIFSATLMARYYLLPLVATYMLGSPSSSALLLELCCLSDAIFLFGKLLHIINE